MYNNKSIVNLVCQVHQTTSSNGRITLVDPEVAGRESVYNNKSIVNLVCQVHQTASSNGRMTLVDGRPRGG